MLREKPRLVIDLPTSIRRKIHHIQQESNAAIVVFSDLLEIVEALEDPLLFQEIVADPRLLSALHDSLGSAVARWQGVLREIEGLAIRTRSWGSPNTETAPTLASASSAASDDSPSPEALPTP